MKPLARVLARATALSCVVTWILAVTAATIRHKPQEEANAEASAPKFGSVSVIPSKGSVGPTPVTATISLGDFPAGGSIGTAPATVDVAGFVEIAQATGGQALTLPNPSVTTNDRTIWVTNKGSAYFTLNGAIVPIGSTQTATWTSGGSTWQIPSGRVPTSEILEDFVANATLPVESVDDNDTIILRQATTGRALTLPTPTVQTSGKIVTITSVGSAPFTINGLVLQPSMSQRFVWYSLPAQEGGFTGWVPLSYNKPSVIAKTNLASGGSFGTAATTVDVGNVLQLAQTTALQSVTIAGPTAAGSNGRSILFQNTGTVPVTLSGLGGPGSIVVDPGQNTTLTWGSSANLWLPPATPSLAAMRFSDVGVINVATRFLAVNGAEQASEASAQYPVVFPVTWTTIRIDASAAPGVGHSTIYTLRKNGVDTALTVTLGAAQTTNSFSAAVSFAAGDLVSVSEVPDGAGNVTADPRVTLSGI